jgi:hypothetical protein
MWLCGLGLLGIGRLETRVSNVLSLVHSNAKFRPVHTSSLVTRGHDPENLQSAITLHFMGWHACVWCLN